MKGSPEDIGGFLRGSFQIHDEEFELPSSLAMVATFIKGPQPFLAL